MHSLIQTADFKSWIKGLKDTVGAARINVRLSRLKDGQFGDVRSVGDGIRELRFMFGPGYRVYYAVIDDQLILLIAGGDKSSQFNDIVKAKQILRQWKEEQNG
jgi:putative addiction module killer protein